MHRIEERRTFYWGRLMSLSDFMVPQMFYMYRGRSFTGMLSLTSSLFLVLSARNLFRVPMLLCQFSFYLSCSFEGRKKTFSSKTSSSLTLALSAGLGISSQAFFTLNISFSLQAYGFSLFSTKSRTTKTICLGFSLPKSFRLSSRMTSSIYSCAPFHVPTWWVHILISRVWEMAKAKREFCL